MNLVNKVVIFSFVKHSCWQEHEWKRVQLQWGNHERLSGSGFLSKGPWGGKQNPLCSQHFSSSEDMIPSSLCCWLYHPELLSGYQTLPCNTGHRTPGKGTPPEHKDHFIIWLWPAFGFPRILTYGNEAIETRVIGVWRLCSSLLTGVGSVLWVS